MITDRIADRARSEGLHIYTIASMDDTGIYERRLNPSNSCTNSYSVAKAFTVTAIGMLRDRHLLCVEDKVYDLFERDFPENFDPGWKTVTVEHLMTHKAGFGRGFLDIDAENTADYPGSDFLQIVLSEPLPYAPGSRYQYTDAAFYLLSRIITKISGEKLVDYLRPVLFGKLGFRELAWSCCPHGYTMGATGLYIRTSDMVKLGRVYACGGSFGGQRIVSEEWVSRVLERGYEFTERNHNGIYAKGGMYGQMLCFSVRNHEAYAWHACEEKAFSFADIFPS